MTDSSESVPSLKNWRWEIRRSSYVLVNPSDSDQFKVSRKHTDVAAALAKHEVRWGAGSMGLTSTSRLVTAAEARELMDALGPLTKRGRAW